MLVVVAFLLGCVLTALVLRRPGATRAAVATAEKAAADATAAAAAAARCAADVASALAALQLVKPAPVGRPAVLASFHSALTQLADRGGAAVPADRLPAVAPPSDARPAERRLPAPQDDRLPRLTPSAAPRDAVGSVPEPYSGEPFHFVGTQNSKVATEEEFPIEWPEPGAVAVAEVSARAESDLEITPMTRTRSQVHTHEPLLNVWDGLGRSRGLLTRDMTHLRIQSQGGHLDWSVRLIGPSDLSELVGEREGTGRQVLAIRPEGPVEVVAHIRSGYWSVTFVCGCWAGSACTCALPKGCGEHGWLDDSVSGGDEGMRTLTVPRPGLLVVEVSKDGDPWHLRTQPVGSSTAED